MDDLWSQFKDKSFRRNKDEQGSGLESYVDFPLPPSHFLAVFNYHAMPQTG